MINVQDYFSRYIIPVISEPLNVRRGMKAISILICPAICTSYKYPKNVL